MGKAIIGKKVGMTQIFDDKGQIVPVTVIQAGPCFVVQTKNTETDGYNAIQVGYDEVKEHRVTKPIKGHFDKAQVKYTKYLREFKVEDINEYKLGQELKADVFKPGDIVDVTGISKGKGFQGVIKKYNFSRGPMSHGSLYHRGVGSLGSVQPARIFKGKRLPGRMGGNKTTVQNLEIVKVDTERNYLLVRGAVPGPKKALVTIKSTVKAQ